MRLATLKRVLLTALTAKTASWNQMPRSTPLPPLRRFFFGQSFAELCAAIVDELQHQDAWPFAASDIDKVVAIVVALLSIYADEEARSTGQTNRNGFFQFPATDHAANDRLVAMAKAVWPQFSESKAILSRNTIVALLQAVMPTKAAARLANPHISLDQIKAFAESYALALAIDSISTPLSFDRVVAVLAALDAFLRKLGFVFVTSTEDLVKEIADAVRPEFASLRAGDDERIRDAALVRIVGWRVPGGKPSRSEIALADDLLLQQIKAHVAKCFDWMRPADEPPRVLGYSDVSPPKCQFLARQLLDRLIHGSCRCASRDGVSTASLTGNAKAKAKTCLHDHRLDMFQPAAGPLVQFLERAVQGRIGKFYAGSFESGMLNHQLRLYRGLDPDFQPVVMDDVLLRQCEVCKTETAGRKCPRCVDGGKFAPGYRIVRLLVREDLLDWTRIEVWRCRECDLAFDVDRCQVRGPGHAHLLISDHDCCPQCGERHGQRTINVLVLQ